LQCIYNGYWKGGKRDGEGTMEYNLEGEEERKSYTGNWKDDKLDGQGTMVYRNGRKIQGAWRNGE